MIVIHGLHIYTYHKRWLTVVSANRAKWQLLSKHVPTHAQRNVFLRNFYSKTRQFLIRRLIIGDDSFWSFARCIVRSTNYHGLKRYTYPDPFRYFTQLFLLFLFHFLFFFRIHAARRHTSSLFFSLSIRSLKNYVTYHDKVAHLLKIKNW